MESNNGQVLTPQLEEDIEKCEWVNPKNIAPYLENTHPSVIDVISEAIKMFHEEEV